MTGWKTWTAAVVSVLYGVGGLLGGLHDADVCVAFVTGGLAIVGIGHKVDKMSDLLKLGK